MFATTTDGVGLWWERLGVGPTVLLIPGRGDSTDLFPHVFIDYLLESGISVVRMDPRDTGLSGHGGDSYTLSTMANDVITVLDAAEADQAHTVAVSMGGMITVDLVSRFRARIASTTLIAAMSPNPDAGMGPDFFAPLGDSDHADLILAAMGSPTEDERRWVIEELDRASQRAPDRPEAIERHMAASLRFGWPEPHQLADFDNPALIVHGTADRLLPLTHARSFSEGIARSDLQILDGMGHLPTRTEWRTIAELTVGHIMT